MTHHFDMTNRKLFFLYLLQDAQADFQILVCIRTKKFFSLHTPTCCTKSKIAGGLSYLVNCVSAAIVIITECRDSKNPVGAHRNAVEMKRLKAIIMLHSLNRYEKRIKIFIKQILVHYFFLRSPSHAILCPKL
jgi:hypothetical protein